MTVREGDRDGLSDEGTTSKHLQEVKKQALRHASPRPRGDMPGEMQEPTQNTRNLGAKALCALRSSLLPWALSPQAPTLLCMGPPTGRHQGH